MQPISPRIAVAPMMDYTDRHCRYFLRLFSSRVWLYTEMVTAEAILHGRAEHLLEFDPREHPVALQLGGGDPQKLAAAAEIGARQGYDEINLNVGCPSDRVQHACFGAALMKQPELVADCVAAMQEAVQVPVTVKTRIGVDEQDDYAHLAAFVETVAAAGCRTFIIHARKAWLQGLSPKQNREIPPLRYPLVYQLKRDFPELVVMINGGIKTWEEIQEHLAQTDGVMLGRAAYSQPWLLAEAEQLLDPQAVPPARAWILEEMSAYMLREMARGVKLQQMARHLMGLFHRQPGARKWRRYLSDGVRAAGNELEFLQELQRLGVKLREG